MTTSQHIELIKYAHKLGWGIVSAIDQVHAVDQLKYNQAKAEIRYKASKLWGR